MSGLSLLTLNIGSPSEERAHRQLAWLATRHEDVLVLTETRTSDGCQHLADAFRTAGYAVLYPKPAPTECGVMVVSKLPVQADPIGKLVSYLPDRVTGVMISTQAGLVRVLGTYVPTRDATAEKTERKRRFLSEFSAALGTPGLAEAGTQTVLLGDLNIVEPDHEPVYTSFRWFEYDFYRGLTDKHGLVDAFRHLYPEQVEHSWIGRSGDGYRYDHAHCSKALAEDLVECEYVHEPRTTRLTDHSGLSLRFGCGVGSRLDTCDPFEAAMPPTLF
ncbi:endonuclease/exonuclease/phosphatase family protein [Actinophytocola oryzae]|uniref:Exodeoxyribonuclease-3 n=1 Tax=Actinophytocola oryzae TaxID=502181 RepID=A0A4R7VUP8_9PSEU|nr:endonuclease/exonuclease/phosphatase family protein [Actinophytocola oryzae]TDV53696.1 exodeoxyribonuclease-3 [Actinophytocola oryzae]